MPCSNEVLLPTDQWRHETENRLVAVSQYFILFFPHVGTYFLFQGQVRLMELSSAHEIITASMADVIPCIHQLF